jgi:hypothetical protein
LFVVRRFALFCVGSLFDLSFCMQVMMVVTMGTTVETMEVRDHQ